MKARQAGPVRAATIAALLALVSSALAITLATPSPAQAQGSLPACRYDDILTSPFRYENWAITLVDTILRVPDNYEPSDLVHVSNAGVPGQGRIRALMVDDLRAMNEAAVKANAAFAVFSAYRSYERQEVVFEDWVAEVGYERALEVSARPGHSEHQLGLGLDFRSHPGGSPFGDDWATTRAGKWLLKNAWRYGFVMSYPKGQLETTCYDYEPWHYRYVGREVAAEIHASKLTPRAFLWANYTTTIVPPSSAPTPSTPGGSPDASSMASPGATPGASVAASVTASTGPTTTFEPSVPPETPGAAPPTSPASNEVVVAAAAIAALALGFGVVALVGRMVMRRGRTRLGL